jgi:pimeloyl-ACP methyl ester carboxylesterase
VKSPTRMSKKRSSRTARWLRLSVFGAGLTGFAVAYRFALSYRERVGLPHRSPVETSPAEFGLAFEQVEIPAGDHRLVGWFVPAETEGAPKKARSGARTKVLANAAEPPPATTAATASAEPPERRPAIVVVHGWESNRGRTFAHARYLHAAGFHCLVFDVRGHGDSPEVTLPVNVPEFAEDTVAAVRWAATRPEVSSVGVLGHSMGGAGAIVAASHEPLIKAVVSASAPADLVRMTRKTFQMAGMQIPEPIATPLAWFTAAVLLIPRRHSVEDASATAAAARYWGPLLLIHGAQDHGVPVAHLELIARAAVGGRGREDDPPVETLVLPDFGHRWLYEDAGCRRKTATFFARWLGGPVAAATAGERAAACVVERPADPIYGFGTAASKTPPSDRTTAFD